MSGSIDTAFTEMFALRIPVACAGMAFATLTPDLPAAVCSAGAAGAIANGIFPPEVTAAMIRALRDRAGECVFHINFLTPFCSEQHIEACIDAGAPAASFHWGHPPAEWIRRLKAAGVSVWEQVGGAAAARQAVSNGVDVIIAQGLEAGGHNLGTLPTFVAVPEIVAAVGDVPVLAAGGIVDGRGLAAVLALGAQGAVIGTRLAATREATVADEYKQRLVQASGDETVMTALFGRDMPGFNPMRVLKNDIVNEWAGREELAPSQPELEPVIGRMSIMGQEMPIHRFQTLVPVAGASGEFDQMPLLSGQGVGGISDLPGAAELLERIAAEAAEILRRLGKSVGG